MRGASKALKYWFADLNVKYDIKQYQRTVSYIVPTISSQLFLFLGNRGDKWLFLNNWRLENIVLDHFFGITGRKVEFFALVDAKNHN